MASLGIQIDRPVIHVTFKKNEAWIDDEEGNRIILRRRGERGHERRLRSDPLAEDGWIVGGGWDADCCPRCVFYRGRVHPRRVVNFPLHRSCHHYWIPYHKGLTDTEIATGDLVDNLNDLDLSDRMIRSIYGQGRLRLMKEDGLHLSDFYIPGTDQLKTLESLGVSRSFGSTGMRLLTLRTIAEMRRKDLIDQIHMRDPSVETHGVSLKRLKVLARRLIE